MITLAGLGMWRTYCVQHAASIHEAETCRGFLPDPGRLAVSQTAQQVMPDPQAVPRDIGYPRQLLAPARGLCNETGSLQSARRRLYSKGQKGRKSRIAALN